MQPTPRALELHPPHSVGPFARQTRAQKRDFILQTSVIFLQLIFPLTQPPHRAVHGLIGGYGQEARVGMWWVSQSGSGESSGQEQVGQQAVPPLVADGEGGGEHQRGFVILEKRF